MSERRYSKEEIETIFKEAQNVDATGLTLPELQEIGREIGVAPEAVARAAAQLELGTPATPSALQAQAGIETKKLMGVPVRVAKTVELPRKLTDSEWDQLVVDLRSTFDARGRIEVQGAFREWRNGQLRAIIEPVGMGTGERFTLRSFKESTAGVLTFGALLAVVGGLVALGLWARAADAADGIRRALIFVGVGGIMFTAAAVRVQSWAATRKQQFEDVVGRLLSAIQRNK